MADFGLPAVNASFNLLSATALCTGLYFIRRRNLKAHRAAMWTALACSSVFLAGYIANFLLAGVTRYPGAGWARTAYLALLMSHMVLAALVVPLVLWTFSLAIRARWSAHRRWARFTVPVWLYVSVTGVIIYAALHRPWR